MADNKAYLESVARSFGIFWKGQKVRVNTISHHQRLQRQVKLLKALMVLLHLLMAPLGNASLDLQIIRSLCFQI
jgi:enoyl-[acyl-carrier protein] reductase I